MEEYLDTIKQIIADLHPELDDGDRDGLVTDGILESIGSIGFQEGDHIRLRNGAGIAVIILEKLVLHMK